MFQKKKKKNQLGSKGDGKNLFRLHFYNQVINQSWLIAEISTAHHVLITLLLHQSWETHSSKHPKRLHRVIWEKSSCLTNCAVQTEEYPALPALRSSLWRTSFIFIATKLISVQWYLIGSMTQIFFPFSLFPYSRLKELQISSSHSGTSHENVILGSLLLGSLPTAEDKVQG